MVLRSEMKHVRITRQTRVRGELGRTRPCSRCEPDPASRAVETGRRRSGLGPDTRRRPSSKTPDQPAANEPRRSPTKPVDPSQKRGSPRPQGAAPDPQSAQVFLRRGVHRLPEPVVAICDEFAFRCLASSGSRSKTVVVCYALATPVQHEEAAVDPAFSDLRLLPERTAFTIAVQLKAAKSARRRPDRCHSCRTAMRLMKRGNRRMSTFYRHR